MLILHKDDGYIVPFVDYDFVKANYVALYSADESYIAEAKDIEESLMLGNCYEEQLPMLYDTAHGPLTDDKLRRYGVPVKIYARAGCNEQNNIRSIAHILRTVRP